MSFVVDWVDDAAKLPIAFAQVREDALVDLAIVERRENPARVLMVASGGCTAAALAASGKVKSLHLVDPNPAQIAISRLKLRLLAKETPASRLALLGHSALSTATRKRRLLDALEELQLAEDALGPLDVVAELGPDFAGRYEQVFLALRLALGVRHADLESLLRLSDPAIQRALVAPGTSIGQALDRALAEVMALTNLVRLFGDEATRNPVEPFDKHFGRRVRHTLGSLPAASNPYLWQMLLGRFPDKTTCPWLAVEAPKALPEITWECDFMLAALKHCADKFDFVHLSNILDWLPPTRASETLEHAWAALKTGGCVLIRQLNSSLDVSSLGPQFHWEAEAAGKLHERDRSFFYRTLHWGFKR